MEAEKRVIAHLESSSATLLTMNGDMVAIPAMAPRTVMILTVVLFKLATLRTWTSVSSMDAVITWTVLVLTSILNRKSRLEGIPYQ